MNKVSKFAFTAALALATVFSFSCSSGVADNTTDGSSSSSVEGSSSSVVNSLSSSVELSSSSIEPSSSSSSIINGGESSSSVEASSSSETPLSSSSVYPTTINGWMTKNIDTDVGNSLCYDNLPENCEKYGRLYDYESALLACPAGTRLPTKEDWEELIAYVENEQGCEDCAGKYLKSAEGWDDFTGVPFIPGNGEDTYGFTALPGGTAADALTNGSMAPRFFSVGSQSSWLTSTIIPGDDIYHSDQVYTCGMSNQRSKISCGGSPKSSYYYSVRCITNPPQTIQPRR